MKYGWTGAGMILISIPILTSKKSTRERGESGISERTEYYTVAKHLLMAGGDAMERLMTAYKEIVELAGYTQRVANMFEVFEDCKNSRYLLQRNLILYISRVFFFNCHRVNRNRHF